MLPGDTPLGQGGVLVDSWFSQLTSLIPAGDLLVLNTTRVRHARLLGTRAVRRAGRGAADPPRGRRQLDRDGQAGQRAPARQARRARTTTVAIETLEVLHDGNRRVRFVGRHRRGGDRAVRPAAAAAVHHPRPHRGRTSERYQTVYARLEGSVAAPTAGLHFTDGAARRALRQGACSSPAWTCRSGRAPSSRSRWRTRASTRCIPSDTRSRSRLAGADRAGARAGRPGVGGGHHGGARARERRAVGRHRCAPARARRSLMITPGYPFRVVDRLITNFHLPRSTLLMLVSAFAGHELTMAAYRHAVSRALSLLLLRRRDGDPLTRSVDDLLQPRGQRRGSRHRLRPGLARPPRRPGSARGDWPSSCRWLERRSCAACSDARAPATRGAGQVVGHRRSSSTWPTRELVARRARTG